MARIAQRLMDMAKDLSEIAVEMNSYRTGDRSTLPRGSVYLNREMFDDAWNRIHVKARDLTIESYFISFKREIFGPEEEPCRSKQ